jgi:hypothetical protein
VKKKPRCSSLSFPVSPGDEREDLVQPHTGLEAITPTVIAIWMWTSKAADGGVVEASCCHGSAGDQLDG